MKDKIKNILKRLLAEGADYADLRWHVEDIEERISTYNGEIDDFSEHIRSGYGIRVYSGGSWGFAASENLSDLDAVADLAMGKALASELCKADPIPLPPREALKSCYNTPSEIDPFTIPLAEKLERILELDREMADEKIERRHVDVSFYKRKILFFDSYGCEIERNLLDIYGERKIFAKDIDGGMQRRSFFLYYDGSGTTGWETIMSDKYFGNGVQMKDELLELLEAPRCEQEVCDVILLNEMMALQTHETIGHPLELDRILGYELAFAGGSHVKLDDFGRLKFGSEKLNAFADGSVENSPGSNGFDDDGEKMHQVQLIESGVLKSAISSRWSTSDANLRMGKTFFEKSGASCRAQSYNKAPIDRMNNINVSYGQDGNLNDFIAKTKRGIIFERPNSWSIGSNRENFHFSCEVAWKIEDGKVVGMLRDATYSGDSLPFWRSLDLVGSEETWQQQIVYSCGKGQPNQIMRLGHGVPICRFKNVQVGL